MVQLTSPVAEEYNDQVHKPFATSQNYPRKGATHEQLQSGECFRVPQPELTKFSIFWPACMILSRDGSAQMNETTGDLGEDSLVQTQG